MNIIYVLGMTDVDDKIINKLSVKSMEAMNTMTKQYEFSFTQDMNALHVLHPHAILRVSQHIPAIIQYIQNIIAINRAYVSDGDVYFDVQSSEATYCRFGHLPGESEGSVHNIKKRFFRDFALWKAAKENEPYWDSPWGKGRPGWHIECSAMVKSFSYYVLIYLHHLVYIRRLMLSLEIGWIYIVEVLI
jgi:cysteinyl-tRNA synthetase